VDIWLGNLGAMAPIFTISFLIWFSFFQPIPVKMPNYSWAMGMNTISANKALNRLFHLLLFLENTQILQVFGY